jgi:1,4-alpha-glucan branching enzyme
MFQKSRKKGMYRFSVKPGNKIARAEVAGDFSNWEPVRMRKNKQGEYVANVPLLAGTYEYKFIIDGDWTVDTENENYSANSFGTMNSVALVEG